MNYPMNLIEKLKQHPNGIKLFLVLFYAIGVTAIYIPFTAGLFISLTPLALLLSFTLLMLFHKNFDLKTIGTFSLIFVAGYFVEVFGVNTGLIFGNYKYGETLGIKPLETPLIMGLNWILMIYLTASIIEKYKIPVLLKILVSSTIMVGYDLVLEQVAPKMDMWSWQNSSVPLQNYIAWFTIAVIFHGLLKISKIETENKLSVAILICQILFFVALLYK